mmetsp:Transcript_9856/g.24785  ORF Transcript_9856/g.24785 Transcript_9856/m.24785 type:complete len:92 (+) Transcript_9856:126-401(+)
MGMFLFRVRGVRGVFFGGTIVLYLLACGQDEKWDGGMLRVVSRETLPALFIFSNPPRSVSRAAALRHADPSATSAVQSAPSGSPAASRRLR